MPPKKRMKPPRDNGRRMKKKISILSSEKIDYIDYKDVNLLRKFMSDRAKIRNRRVTGNDSQQQREVARAIKNAREMALVPYANRVTTQRGGKGRDGDRDRGPRGEGGAPGNPSVPPPPPGGAPGGDSDGAADAAAESAGEEFEYPAELENVPGDAIGDTE